MAANNAFASAQLIFSEMQACSIPRDEAPKYLAPLIVPEGIERVYVGSLTHLFRRLGYVSLATYHTHKNNLIAMGCIRRLQQGRFEHTPSVWTLHHEPTYSLWIEKVGQHLHQRDAEILDQHARALENFLASAPSLYPRLLQQAAKGGARSREDFLAFLAALPEPTLRSLHPLCLAFALPGCVHTCGVARLDVLAVSSHEGSWKRRRDHLARLELQESPLP